MMKLNNNEIFCLIEILEEYNIYPLEPEKVGEYLIKEDYILTQEGVIDHILEIKDLCNIPEEWLNFKVILEEDNQYHQIGEDRFINTYYLNEDIDKIRETLIEKKLIRNI